MTSYNTKASGISKASECIALRHSTPLEGSLKNYQDIFLTQRAKKRDDNLVGMANLVYNLRHTTVPFWELVLYFLNHAELH